MKKEWQNFKEGKWTKEINVSDFIKKNYKSYKGDETFLEEKTEKTTKIWKECEKLLKKELKKHVLDIETNKTSGINEFYPGYISKDDNVVVGLQTDKPLKRIVNPYGGMRMVYQELNAYGYKLNKEIDYYFNKYRKTHNQGVFDAYTDDIKKARHVGLLTGLPDAYGRGRIIGDYRRIALYGIDFLINQKQKDLQELTGEMNDELIRLREEVSMQINALNEIKEMGKSYGFDLSKPAKNSKEAVQWTYFGYLAAIKENNGAAMSLGRVDAFLDIYFERDLKTKKITFQKLTELFNTQETNYIYVKPNTCDYKCMIIESKLNTLENSYYIDNKDITDFAYINEEKLKKDLPFFIIITNTGSYYGQENTISTSKYIEFKGFQMEDLKSYLGGTNEEENN